jgi:hypothetical protein
VSDEWKTILWDVDWKLWIQVLGIGCSPSP